MHHRNYQINIKLLSLCNLLLWTIRVSGKHGLINYEAISNVNICGAAIRMNFNVSGRFLQVVVKIVIGNEHFVISKQIDTAITTYMKYVTTVRYG